MHQYEPYFTVSKYVPLKRLWKPLSYSDEENTCLPQRFPSQTKWELNLYQSLNLQQPEFSWMRQWFGKLISSTKELLVKTTYPGTMRVS